MTTNVLRQKFLDFFASKGHTVVVSDSLVPKDDPTVLFTTAGMQQFKRQFLGDIGNYTRAASSQKCLRTDDLDKVGKTAYHHTFFEMLGNFSFGDYFKKEAIVWAWEFLTVWLKIPAERWWASVYEDDDEAAQIWLKDINIDPKKLIRLGDKSNFWPAEAKEKGPNGPCGPCSEIFYDYGPHPECQSKKCDPSCDCGRFSEIWNLVFTQFNRQEGGVLEPLPNKNIDTGMGLERLAAVVQGKKSNYATDLFAPILDHIDVGLGKNVPKEKRYVIADHVRAMVFAINDGVVPSNKERGAVVKKLIYEIADIVLRNANKSPSALGPLIDSVVHVMKEPYAELLHNWENIRNIVEHTAKSYEDILTIQIPKLEKEIDEIKMSSLKNDLKIEKYGELAFRSRDTHGISLAGIRSAFTRRGIGDSVQDSIFKIYEVHMERQKKQSRSASKMVGDVFTSEELDLDIPKTKFKGYEQTQSVGTILRLYITNQKVKEVSKDDPVKVVLDQTPFYAGAGGQIGDTGYIIGPKGKIRVEDTQKINDVYVHRGMVQEGLLRVDERVEAKIDVERRLAIMRHHTATHLLQAALREILGKHVQQQGSLVAEDRLRFDFAHPKALSKEEIQRIEDRVNEHVAAGIAVHKEVLDLEEAKKKGALAFFAEKYGQKVRVVSIGNISKEFCGGTHLNNTSAIGTFKITSEGAIAQGIRRLEAKTGQEAELFIQKKQVMDRESAELAKAKELERELEKKKFSDIRNSIDTVIKDAEEINGTKIVYYTIPDASTELLRKAADLVKQKVQSSAVLVGTTVREGSSCVLAVTPDLVTKGIKANELMKEIANGSGGGQPQMAQAGSKDVNWVKSAIKKAVEILREKLQRKIQK